MSSVNLSVWCLVAIAVTLAVGNLYARWYPGIIGRLDCLRFQDWISLQTLSAGWWILLLFIIILLLVLNTVVCTANRLLVIFRKKQKTGASTFLLDLSPSLMHLCFIIIIFGHALSQFTSITVILPAQPGAVANLAAMRVTVENQACTTRKGPTLKEYVKQCFVTVRLETPDGVIRREVSVLHPIFREDYVIHLNVSGRAKHDRNPQFHLLIKKDPGLKPMLFAGSFFCMLALWYFVNIRKSRRGEVLSW